MIRKILVVLALSLIVLFFMSIGFMVGSSSGAKAKKAEEKVKTEKENETVIPSVKTLAVKLQDLPLTIKGDGRVTSLKTVKVSSEVQGKITQGKLKTGTSFSKGQLLYEIDSKEYILGLKAKKSTYLTQIASILPDLQLDYASSYQKWSTYYQSIDPEKALPTLPTFSTTKEKTFISSKGILAEYYTIKGMEERASKYKYYAPFSGNVVMSYADKGTIINPGSFIIDIIQTGSLEVEIPLTLNAAKLISTGKKVSLVNKSTGKEFKGTVSRKGSFVNASTQSIPVYVTLNNNKELYNGMYLSATFVTDVAKDVVEVSKSSIYENSYVYTLKDSTIIKNPITIVSSESSTTYIKGVSNNDVIVNDFIKAPKEGMKVSPIDQLK